jgi:uncharacterized membrane protein
MGAYVAWQAYDRTMHGKRTWRWWMTRIELAIGMVAVVVGVSIVPMTLPSYIGAPFLEPVVPRPWGLLIVLGALVGLVVGLVWMMRIAEVPTHESPPWRYRAH